MVLPAYKSMSNLSAQSDTRQPQIHSRQYVMESWTFVSAIFLLPLSPSKLYLQSKVSIKHYFLLPSEASGGHFNLFSDQIAHAIFTSCFQPSLLFLWRIHMPGTLWV